MVSEQRDEVFDKPYAYEDDDGRVVYRSSSLGACTGALVRARLGVTGSAPSDMMQERFDEGHDWEARVLASGLEAADFTQTVDLDYLAPYGRVVESEAGLQVETEVAWSNKVVRCHPDAIVTKRATLEKYVCEVKFLGEQMFNDIVHKDAMSEMYKWQVAIEMLSTGLPMLYVVGKKVVKLDADGTGERVVELGEVWTTEILEPPYSLKEVKARVLEVEGYVARGEMPACPTPFMYPCPYWADHEARERPVIEDEVLGEWVEVWKLADKAFGVAVKDLEFAKGAVREQMAELGLSGGVCRGVDITVVEEGAGNVSWAKWAEAVLKAHPEVDDVDKEKFRGKPRAGYIKIAEVKK